MEGFHNFVGGGGVGGRGDGGVLGGGGGLWCERTG